MRLTLLRPPKLTARRRSILPKLAGLAALIPAAFLLSACVQSPDQADVYTPYPPDYIPTAVALTIQASEEPGAAAAVTPSAPADPPAAPPELPSPTATVETPAGGASSAQDSPTPTGSTPTVRVTRTPTATPVPPLPIAAIQILKPGPASKVVSPLGVNLYLKTGERGTARVDLLGEDGRLLVRKVLSLAPATRVEVAVDLEFEIPSVAEAARLVVLTDDNDGRTTALASVDLVLLAHGRSDLNPAGDQLERIIVREPSPSRLIQGGELIVSGLAVSNADQPLYLELIESDGSLLGPGRQVIPSPPEDGTQYGKFTTSLPYSVQKTTWVLLVVYQESGRIPGQTHLSSVSVLLSP